MLISLLNRHKYFQQSSWHLISHISAKGLQQTLAPGWGPLSKRGTWDLPLFLVLPSEDYASSSFYKDWVSPGSKQSYWICRRHWACSLFQPRERRLTSNPALLWDWLTGMVGIWLHRRLKLSEPGIFLEHSLHFLKLSVWHRHRGVKLERIWRPAKRQSALLAKEKQ